MKRMVIDVATGEAILEDLSQEEIDAKALETAAAEATSYREERARNYPPIGDQLDAILRVFKKLREDGNTLDPEMDAILTSWLAVKAEYPKPGEGDDGP